MPRYLLYISYVGTYFRAVQKQIFRKEPEFKDPESVQGILEIACERFKPANNPQVYVSSRYPKFNVELMKQAAALFPGVKDFRSFMSSAGDNGEISTIRDMKELSIQPGHPFLSNDYVSSCNHYDFWEVTCKGKSFLYKQVRRTVAVLIAVAQGKLTLEDVQYMLDVPSKDSWNPKAATAPAYGLYLVNVEYDLEDLLYERKCHNQDIENKDL